MTAQQIPLFDTRSISYRFRKDSLGAKRPNVEVEVKVPSVAGIIEILQNKDTEPKFARQWELVQEALLDKIQNAGLILVNDDTGITSENFPAEKITWEFIANQPKADRRAAIPAEVWEAFGKTYLEVMPALTGKTLESCQLAVNICLKKLIPVRGSKGHLSTMKQLLAIFANQPQAEQFEEIIGFLDRKLDTFLAEVDEVHLEGL